MAASAFPPFTDEPRVRPRPDLRRLLLGLLPPVSLFVVYVPILGFPYFWDDLFILKWVHSVPLETILTQVGFLRFRIFDRLLFRLSFDGLGPRGATAMHGLTLALGMLNVTLVARTARDLSGADGRRWAAGAVAGLAFALFPLSYRDMAGAAAIAHLGVTAASLVALALAREFVRTGRRSLLSLSLLMAVLAPLTAESGILAGLIVAGYVALKPLPGLAQRVRWTIALHSGASLILGGWIALVTRQGIADGTEGDFLSRTAFFLQALAYPAAPLARWIAARSGLYSLAVMATGLAVIGLLTAFLIRSSMRRLFLFGLLWFGLASAIPWWALSFDYLVNAPHVYYFVSAGVAMVWAALLAHGLDHWPPAGRRLTLSLALIFLAGNVLWVNRGIRLYLLGLQPLRALARAADEHPGAKILAVNLPAWLAWPLPFFALGNEGAIVLSDESPAQLFLDYNSRSGARVEAVYVPDLQALTPFYAAVHGTGASVDGLSEAIRAARAVYLTAYQPGRIELRDLGTVQVDSLPGPNLVARFVNGLALEAVDLRVDGRSARLTLDWRLAAPPSDHNFFAHVFDCAGNVLALTDGPAIGGLYPLRLWHTGEAVHEVRYAALERAAPDGCYVMEIGLFDTLTGDRVPVFDAAGNEYPNRAVALTRP